MGVEKQTRAGEWNQGLSTVRYKGMFLGGGSVVKLYCGNGCTSLSLMKSVYVFNPVRKLSVKLFKKIKTKPFCLLI